MMVFFKIVLITVEVICSLLLIVVILLQRAKGEGLGLAFGAQMGESLFGARASNVLVKITIWLGVIFLISTTLLARMYARGIGGSVMETRAPAQSAPAGLPAAAPGSFPAAQPALPAMPEAQPAAPSAAPTLPESPVAPAAAPESAPPPEAPATE